MFPFKRKNTRREVSLTQRDSSDCGAACLCAVAASYHRHIPIMALRALAGTSQQGTTALGMIDAAEKSGFQARAIRTTAEHLQAVPFPAIAHVKKGNTHHYVVVYKCGRKKIRVMDPAYGKPTWEQRGSFEEKWTGILLLLHPAPHFEKNGKPRATSTILLQLLQPHFRTWWRILAGGMVYALLGLVSSIYVQQLIDHILPSGNTALLHVASLLMFSAIICQVLIAGGKAAYAQHLGLQLDASLLAGYYRQLFKLPPGLYDSMRAGDLMNRMGDAGKLRQLITELIPQILSQTLMLTGALAMMFLYHPSLALNAMLPLPFLLLLYVLMNKLNTSWQRKLMEQAATLESVALDGLLHARLFRHASKELLALERMLQQLHLLLHHTRNGGIKLIRLLCGTELITKMAGIFLLWTGALQVVNQELTTGELMSFFTLSGFITGPVIALIQVNKPLRESLIAAERLFELHAVAPEETETTFQPDISFQNSIRIQNLSFGYHGHPPVLRNLHMHIPKGSFVVVTGKSGSGKSTLAQLFMKELEPSAGGIFMDGIPWKNIPARNIRKLMGFVPQQVPVLNDQLLFNITLNANCNIALLRNALQTSGMTKVLEQIPNGLNTLIGSNGHRLSGGEIQKLGLARVFYNNAPILLLDEATAHLDANAERKILKAIDGFHKLGNTVIFITHKLSSVTHCDAIYVLEKGEIVAHGTHEQLINEPGPYQQIWKDGEG